MAQHPPSVEISDVRVVEMDLRKSIATNKDLQRCLEYAKQVHPNPMTLMPKPHHKVDFVLKNSSPDFANAIRRCLVDELPVRSLSFDLSNLETDDPYVLSDVMQNEVMSVPINQDAAAIAAPEKLRLHVVNNTAQIINITTQDVRLAHPAGSAPPPPVDFWEPNVCIAKLHPAKHLTISAFKIVTGRALEHSGQFTLLANVRYGSDQDKSSLVSRPSTFRIGYTTYGNIAPLRPMQMCCDELLARLDRVKAAVAAPAGSSVPKTIKIEYMSNDLVQLTIDNESWTLVNMITARCFSLDPLIPLVVPFVACTHSSQAVLKIVHPDWKALITKAIDLLRADFEAVKKAFAK